ncbi:hypothetical protein TCON_1762 [Astathelohania contejeani]|uniref:Uncharacterized protein n=1 Tax=Astathelohania contejeani TaxID=164912 RepID=A0ABQ7HXY6_9MICR|nr:hypothetical protein TCON_1762 [Thelohania contejeani]
MKDILFLVSIISLRFIQCVTIDKFKEECVKTLSTFVEQLDNNVGYTYETILLNEKQQDKIIEDISKRYKDDYSDKSVFIYKLHLAGNNKIDPEKISNEFCEECNIDDLKKVLKEKNNDKISHETSNDENRSYALIITPSKLNDVDAILFNRVFDDNYEFNSSRSYILLKSIRQSFEYLPDISFSFATLDSNKKIGDTDYEIINNIFYSNYYSLKLGGDDCYTETCETNIFCYCILVDNDIITEITVGDNDDLSKFYFGYSGSIFQAIKPEYKKMKISIYEFKFLINESNMMNSFIMTKNNNIERVYFDGYDYESSFVILSEFTKIFYEIMVFVLSGKTENFTFNGLNVIKFNEDVGSSENDLKVGNCSTLFASD